MLALFYRKRNVAYIVCLAEIRKAYVFKFYVEILVSVSVVLAELKLAFLVHNKGYTVCRCGAFCVRNEHSGERHHSHRYKRKVLHKGNYGSSRGLTCRNKVRTTCDYRNYAYIHKQGHNGIYYTHNNARLGFVAL